jgi:hypothetical protein
MVRALNISVAWLKISVALVLMFPNQLGQDQSRQHLGR